MSSTSGTIIIYCIPIESMVKFCVQQNGIKQALTYTVWWQPISVKNPEEEIGLNSYVPFEIYKAGIQGLLPIETQVLLTTL